MESDSYLTEDIRQHLVFEVYVVLEMCVYVILLKTRGTTV